MSITATTSFEPIAVPDQIVDEWQEIVNMLAEIMHVPAALIMRLHGHDIEVFVSSKSKGNPYKPGDHERFFDSGLYCETVIRSKERLIVPNALIDDTWKNNPDIKLNMVSYLGYPILLPGGEPYGTICVLDNKENAYSPLFETFIEKMRDVIHSQIGLVYMNYILGDEKRQLEEYIEEIHQLRGIIPICMYCKNIRDDDGYWEQVEKYLTQYPDTTMSHCICPECMKKHHPTY